MMQFNSYTETNYKETEIGFVPMDWEIVRLGDISNLTMGQSPPSENYNLDGIGLPFFQGKAEFGVMYPTPEKYCSQPLRIAAQGNVLISVRAPVGDVNIAPFDCCIGRGLAAIEATPQSDNHYLFYLLIFAKRRLEDEGTGSTFQSINKSVISNLIIPLPPLPEQKRIAAVLNTIQDEIAAQDDIIAEAREFKRSLMHRLFTYSAGENPAETKETEIGEIPAHWEVVAVEELFDIKLGKMLSQKAMQGKAPRPYIRNANVQWGHIDVTDIKEMDFSPSEMEKFRLRRDDVLVCEGGEIGRTALWEDQLVECYYQKALHRLRPKNADRILPKFFSHYMYLLFAVRQVPIVAGAQSTIAHLPMEKLQTLPVTIPSFQEQYEITEQLDVIEKKIAVEEDRKAAMQDFFKTMLHQLMSGQIRLIRDGELSPQ